MPPKIYNAKNAKTAKNAKKAKKAKNANLLQSATQSATTKGYSTTMGRAKKGGRRWSPPGGFNTISCGGRPPPKLGTGGRPARRAEVAFRRPPKVVQGVLDSSCYFEAFFSANFLYLQYAS